MRRLTERDEYGNADVVALSDMMPEIYAGLSFSETNAMTDTLNRLAEYEDTGLMPDEITVLIGEKRGEWELTEYNGFLRCSKCKDCYIEADWIERNRGRKWQFCPTCGVRLALRKMDGDDRGRNETDG